MLRTWKFRAISVLSCSVVLWGVFSGFETCTAATASIESVQHEVASGHSRIVIGLDSEARFESTRIADPDRVFLDISDSKLSDVFQADYPSVKDELAKQIRVAQNRPGVVRVVLNTSGTTDYQISQLHDPYRIVVDLRSASPAKTDVNRLAVSTTPCPVAARRTAPLVSAAVARSSVQGKGKSTVAADSVATAADLHDPEPVLIASSAASSTVAATSAAAEPELPSPSSTADVVIIEPSPEKPMGIIPSVTPTPGNVKKVTTSSEQERLPLTVSGTLSSGYYSSFTRGGGNGDQRVSFIPAGAAFDVNGYYMSPDTLDYTIRSKINAGAQASDAGIEGGNGIRLSMTALRRGVFPTTFRYSNVQLKDAYFGSLAQVSSYTLNNRNKDWGFTTGLKANGLPSATLDWGSSSVQSRRSSAQGLFLLPCSEILDRTGF